MSRNDIDHMTIRFSTCHFLLMSHWNRASIFTRFCDICMEGVNLQHKMTH